MLAAGRYAEKRSREYTQKLEKFSPTRSGRLSDKFDAWIGEYFAVACPDTGYDYQNPGNHPNAGKYDDQAETTRKKHERVTEHGTEPNGPEEEKGTYDIDEQDGQLKI
jgi:hypothetical protein